jgi:hypothetical protein
VVAARSTGGLVTLFITDRDQLIASSLGKTCCLDLFTGALKWKNTMDVSYYWHLILSTECFLTTTFLGHGLPRNISNGNTHQ